ncbi:Protein of unknown function [Poseidonocella pacifica]|uniref:DUF2793 domain-containing protein n=1 Tax=Poseidonocella pacifica TaxID=871651 RepID=A0A1I0XTQ6_9RHOB|nr:DUF2793 domain-containing protein [Poseidonocella pacifica]SFB04392.1 Protein of unknown function [Poseidonocella pacifica]
MTETSPTLQLPYIQPAQAQKHVTHNEALRVLDALIQLSVVDAALTSPPVTPEMGSRYIVASGATGEWAGQDHAVTLFGPTGWEFHAPQPGWRADDQVNGTTLRFDGVSWTPLATRETDRLGVNTAADDTTRLSVSADATALSHAGGSHHLKINKAQETETASLLLQAGWSGRAELGTAGNDDFSIKVSADGSAWSEALRVDAADGTVNIQGAFRLPPTIISDLPAGAPMGSIAFVSDDDGGPQIVYSDGENWRRGANKAII